MGDLLNVVDFVKNVKLQMGDCSPNTHMFSIEIGGCDIVLGVEWIKVIGSITMDFLELYMSFHKDANSYMLKGFKTYPMENILKRGHHDIVTHSYAIQSLCNTYHHVQHNF